MPTPTPFSLALSFAALMALSAAPVLAQSDSTETPPAATDAPADDDAPAPGVPDGLSLGEEVTDEPQVGQTYIGQKFGDWSMRCIRTESGDDPCQMYQFLVDDEETPLAEVSLFRLPEGGQAVAGATVIVPLETSLAAQLSIRIDENPVRRYPFAFCNQIGCYARLGLTEADVTAFKRGGRAVLTIVPVMAPDQQVNIPMSLSGFTASYDVVSVIDQ
ncbi:invasion associated locus B family protein [uncultured Roseobacter sp.]|uniref:invasion associated locus B family protein n=1 Tax=uncultured Roseobacter sp. TaxID=114847 RepID=UPI0026243B0F|nr:invasion associated locus B family protein [uncultured Roseobacter sp.]